MSGTRRRRPASRGCRRSPKRAGHEGIRSRWRPDATAPRTTKGSCGTSSRHFAPSVHSPRIPAERAGRDAPGSEVTVACTTRRDHLTRPWSSGAVGAWCLGRKPPRRFPRHSVRPAVGRAPPATFRIRKSRGSTGSRRQEEAQRLRRSRGQLLEGPVRIPRPEPRESRGIFRVEEE